MMLDDGMKQVGEEMRVAEISVLLAEALTRHGKKERGKKKKTKPATEEGGRARRRQSPRSCAAVSVYQEPR